jgi:hypothetical protein
LSGFRPIRKSVLQEPGFIFSIKGRCLPRAIKTLKPALKCMPTADTSGERLPGTPDYIAEDNGALAWIHENYIKIKKRRGKSKKDRKGVKLEPLTDEEILEKARTAENHKEFNLLWEGKWQEAGYPSQSEADLALCCMLAFWSGKNKEQMDRLFRNSGLFREKCIILSLYPKAEPTRTAIS